MSSLGFQFDDCWLQFGFLVWISDHGEVLDTFESVIPLISSNPVQIEQYVSAFTSQLIIEMESETFKNVINFVSMFGLTGTYCKVISVRFRCEINFRFHDQFSVSFSFYICRSNNQFWSAISIAPLFNLWFSSLSGVFSTSLNRTGGCVNCELKKLQNIVHHFQRLGEHWSFFVLPEDI